ncbi:MAG: hypothetical protein KJO98_04415 [Rhodothermia bacterium]|nr:hypothetical protein [Rhodothermia bacterium]
MARSQHSDASRGDLLDVRLSIDADRVVRILLFTMVTVELLLVVLDYHVNYGRLIDLGPIRRLFNATREDSLASFVAVTQTILVAASLWFVYAISVARQAARRIRWSWLVIALFFSYMAVDDGALIHERVATVIDQTGAAGDSGAGGDGFGSWFPSYTWHVAFMPVFGLLGLYMAFFLWNEMRTRAERLLVSVCVFSMAVAVGLDFVEGLEADHPLNVYSAISNSTAIGEWTAERFGRSGFQTLRHFSKVLEETIEIFAITALWVALLKYTFGTARNISVSISRSAGRSSRVSRRARSDSQNDRSPKENSAVLRPRRGMSTNRGTGALSRD